jgi:glycosyltransferase involved in cell wall biosynthesis
LRVLHLSPQADHESGIAAYAVRFRRAVATQTGVEIEPLDRVSRAPDTIGDIRQHAAAAVRAARRFDVVHAELGGSALRELYAARAVVRAGGPPVVLTAHDPPRLAWRPFHTAAVREHRSLRAIVAFAGDVPARRLEQGLAHRAAAILTLSRRGAERAAAELGGGARFATLPYPCDPARPVPRTGAPEPDAPLVLGFHGYWYGGKGIELLLEALALLRGDGARRPVRLRLWGTPPAGGGARAGDRYRAAILATVGRLDLADGVDVLGPLPAGDVAARLGECDAIVLPYVERRTAAGLVSISSAAFDALSAGTPVVAADARAIAEMIDAGVDGLTVPPGDAEALAAALRLLRDQPAVAARLRAGAIVRARTLGLVETGCCAARVYAAAVTHRG